MKLITLTSVKEFIEKTDSTHDDLLNSLIDEVSQRIESYLNRKLTKAQYTEFFNGGRTKYYLKAYPIAENLSWKTITGVTLSSGSNVSIQAASHGLSTGDVVTFQSVDGTTELNGNYYNVTKTDDNNFTLDGTESDHYTAFGSGGSVGDITTNSIILSISGNTNYTLNNEYYLWKEEGMLELITAPTTSLPNQIMITYTGGYTSSGGVLSVPDDLKRACKVQVAFDFHKRKDLGNKYTALPDGGTSVESSAELLPEVKAILKNHRNYFGNK